MPNRPPNNLKAFLETSVVREKLFGHTAVRENIEKQLHNYQCHTSFFVWMEYKRGLICNLIEFYFNLQSDRHKTVQDVITWWNQDFAARKLKDVDIDIAWWFSEIGVGDNRELALLKWKGVIIRVIESFEFSFAKRGFVKNQTKCMLAKINLAEMEDKGLSKFYQNFQEDQAAKCDIKNLLRRNKSNLNKIKQADSINKPGFKRQIKNLGDLKIEDYHCKDCKKIGDTIIAIECPRDHKLFTTDTAFEELCPLLGKEYKVLPSTRSLLPAREVLKELKEPAE